MAAGNHRRRPVTASALLAAVLVLALVGGCGDQSQDGTAGGTAVPSGGAVHPATAPGLPDGERATVTRVVDGDTVVLADDRRVRLIGVDTPETVHPSKPVECFGKEASAFTAQLLPPGTEVLLEYDVERLDRYDRTLAYVYRVDDGRMVNLELALGGYAQQLTVPPNVRHADRFGEAVAEARSAQRGLWGEVCGGRP